MGRGDSRSRKGKIFKASYGKTRPHTKRKVATAKTSTPGKAETKTTKAGTTKPATSKKK